MGIDAATPRLSWRLQDDRTGASQTAWQLFVSTDSADLLKGKGNTWETGKISSSVQTVPWLYKSPGGIRPDPDIPGFKNILLEPHVPKGLDRFEASHEGPFGTIHSSWKRSGKKITYTVIVPPNSTASVRLQLLKGQHLYFNGKLVNTVAGVFLQKIKAGAYQYELE